MRRIFVLSALLAAALAQGITVSLRNSFVDEFRRRTTISGSFIVHAAHETPNTIAKDGDMHIAGECDSVGLPMVAEIMNARNYAESGGCLELVHQLEADGEATTIEGVWRLWFEHPGSQNQTQFGNNPLHGPDTNPDHVFEIHPVTKFGPHSLLDSFARIKEGNQEFAYKKVEDAIDQWKNKSFTVQPAGTRTKITSKTASFNYVKMRVAKLPDSTFEVEDGTFMYASVYGMSSNKRLKRKARLVLVEGTDPQEALRDADVGQKVTVIAMPRVSLSLVAWRRDNPEGRNWTLPYELVIVAVF